MPDVTRLATRVHRPLVGVMLALAVGHAWAEAPPVDSSAAASPIASAPAEAPPVLAPVLIAEDGAPAVPPTEPFGGTIDPSGSYVETGEASWYGQEFAGRPTASGERFDMQALTVAHPSLPLGSVVEIHNLENGRRTLARINDRGPFVRDRIVDCSLAVARALGFVGKGLAHVQLTVLEAPVHVPAVMWRRLHPPASPAQQTPELPAARAARPVAGPAPAIVASLAAAPQLVAEGTVTRRASVLPFPALVNASRWLVRALVGPCVDDTRHLARDPFDSAAVRRFVGLFTR